MSPVQEKIWKDIMSDNKFTTKWELIDYIKENYFLSERPSEDDLVEMCSKLNYHANIVRYSTFDDKYIILAQDEQDYWSKNKSISRGDVKGFITFDFLINKLKEHDTVR